MSVLDPVENFAKVTVDEGHDEQDLIIILEANEGAKLPAPATQGAFNLTWWNSTDYEDPTDQHAAYLAGTEDEDAEIVRCTARSSDTITITRAQEGTTATAHNKTGKTQIMMLGLTKKTIDDLDLYINTWPYTNVMDYGAVGDGTTDDTVAIQAAIDSLGTNGGIVMFPAGKTFGVNTTATITLKQRVHLMGSGWYSTVLKCLVNNTMITLPTPGIESFCTISNMLLNGNSKTGIIIDVNGNSYFHMHDCLLANMTTGVDLTTTGSTYTRLERLRFSDLTNGVLFDTAIYATRILDSNFETIANAIITSSTFEGDDIVISGNTFGGSGAVNFIKLLSNGSSYGGYNIMAIIENNRFDPSGGPTTSVINAGQDVRAIIKGNSLLSGVANLMIIDGTGVYVEGNHLADSSGSAISLTANSTGCYIGPQLWATGTRACASKITNIGTGNQIYQDDAYHILDNTGTPSVAGYSAFITGGTTAITAFDDGISGQIIYIVAAHNVTITYHADTMRLAGGVNYVMANPDTLTLMKVSSTWYEIARSNN